MRGVLLEHLMRGDNADPPPKLAPDVEALRLTDALVALQEHHEFRVGMIVRQKPQAAIYSTFGDNGMAIVVEVLNEPILTGGDDKQGKPALPRALRHACRLDRERSWWRPR